MVTAWKLLAHAASAPVENLERARAQVTARAAMMRRGPLHRYTHARLAALIPEEGELAASHGALSLALSDASLAMVMSDAISPEHYQALLSALHVSITAADHMSGNHQPRADNSNYDKSAGQRPAAS